MFVGVLFSQFSPNATELPKGHDQSDRCETNEKYHESPIRYRRVVASNWTVVQPAAQGGKYLDNENATAHPKECQREEPVLPHSGDLDRRAFPIQRRATKSARVNRPLPGFSSLNKLVLATESLHARENALARTTVSHENAVSSH
jgi:hypothetical protein